jgi:hypothetical protein
MVKLSEAFEDYRMVAEESSTVKDDRRGRLAGGRHKSG